MFCLRTIGTDFCCDQLCQVLQDSKNTNELLEHELAYVLGQILGVRDEDLLDKEKIQGIKSRNCYQNVRLSLEKCLQDTSRSGVVRHEAGEALAAMLSTESLPVLKELVSDPVHPEVADTCQLSVARLEFYENLAKEASPGRKLPRCNPFMSVDPAPPLDFLTGQKRGSPELLKTASQDLVDPKKPIFDRYACMFYLRNELCSGHLTEPSQQSVALESIGTALHCPSSALFRHEIGYILGQILSYDEIDPKLVETLINSLEKSVRTEEEHGMVRHESAMALGEMETEQSKKLLEEFSRAQEKSDILRDSCVVALNMVEDTQAWLKEQFAV